MSYGCCGSSTKRSFSGIQTNFTTVILRPDIKEHASSEAERWQVTCAYDGTAFRGWQSQPGGHTIQDHLEARLSVIFDKPIRIHGAGRTDAGVHARAQMFHFDGAWPHGPEKLIRALRSGLPDGIQVTNVKHVSSLFHARFSAVGKRYCYRWYAGFAPPWASRYCYSLRQRTLDVAAMDAAAKQLLGEHDFTAFGANRGDGTEDDPMKTLWRMAVVQRGKQITFTTEGSGYLYKMVRSLAGTLERVGQGKLEPDAVRAILESGKRPLDVETAPAKGLWLERVFYRLPTSHPTRTKH